MRVDAAHPRPRHAHTQSALHDADRGNRMARAPIKNRNLLAETLTPKFRDSKNFLSSPPNCETDEDNFK